LASAQESQRDGLERRFQKRRNRNIPIISPTVS
jgi:hypothetical protein